MCVCHFLSYIADLSIFFLPFIYTFTLRVNLQNIRYFSIFFMKHEKKNLSNVK